MKFKLSIGFFIFFAVVLASCGTDKSEEIVGEWKNINGQIISFTTDGYVKGLARNVKQEFVDGSFVIRNDSLLVEFLVVPEPRNLKGTLEFKIEKLDSDSLVLATIIGNIVYSRIADQNNP